MTNTNHRDAVQILEELLEHIGNDLTRCFSLFTEDAVVEFPYARSEQPARLEGKAAIQGYFRKTPDTFLELRFRDLRLYRTTDPDVALAEVHGSAIIAPTGKPYEQDYVLVLRTRKGKVVHYREYWNLVPALEAFGGAEALSQAVHAS